MMKKEETKPNRIEAYIPDDIWPKFLAEAKEKQWSNKKLAENIIIAHYTKPNKTKKK